MITLLVDWGRRMAKVRHVLGAVLITIALGAYAFDIADRFGALPSHPDVAVPEGVVQGWGLLPGSMFEMTINGTLLTEYAQNYKMALLINVPYADIDQMTDTLIGKEGWSFSRTKGWTLEAEPIRHGA